MSTWLAIAVVGWTMIAWGGRIGLLADGEAGPWDWVRIAGSIAVGLAAAGALYFLDRGGLRSAILAMFALWTVVIWGRSLFINWSGSGSLPFKLVHTVLAIGFFVLAWLSLSSAGGDAVSSPDEAHGQQQGDGEAAGLA